MTQTTTLFGRCGELFAGYPLAARDGAMILTCPDGETAFVLDGNGPSYSVRPWRQAGSAQISPEGADVPDWAARAVTDGIPLPADGSLLGWAPDGTVTAMVAFYAASPLPVFSVMPAADAGKWPPFAGEHVVGPWLWEHYRAGRLVDLRSLIGSSAGAVFWVDTVASLGSACAAVAVDISGDGIVLPRGRYVYFKTLAAGVPLPSLDDLLADERRVDLGPRFPLDSLRSG